MAFQDWAHPVEKHFCPGNWERKICWGSGGSQHHQNPQLGLHLEFSPQPLELHRNAWSKPILRQEGRSRTAAEEAQSRKEGEPGHGVTEETPAWCWFWFPKAVCSEHGEAAGFWTGSGAVSGLIKTILSSLCVHKHWSLHARAAGVPPKCNTCLLYTAEQTFGFLLVDSLFPTRTNRKLCTYVWKHWGMWNPTWAVAVSTEHEQALVLWSWPRCCCSCLHTLGTLHWCNIFSPAWVAALEIPQLQDLGAAVSYSQTVLSI